MKRRLAKDYVNVYRKGLPHDPDLIVKRSEIRKLIEAITTNDWVYLNTIDLGSSSRLSNVSQPNRRLENLQPNFRFCLPETAASILDLYMRSLCRDIPFDCLAGSELGQTALRELSKVFYYKLRAENTIGDQLWPESFPSQFLYYQTLSRTYTPEVNYLITWNDVITSQNGIKSPIAQQYVIDRRYIITPRDLCTFCDDNDILSIYLNLYMTLVRFKFPLNEAFSSLVQQSKNEQLGIANSYEIRSTLCRVAKRIDETVHRLKWSRMVPRPEEMGIEIERVMANGGCNPYFISSEIINSEIMKLVFGDHQSCLLSVINPNGCPKSPSYPSLTAAMASGLSTIMKFYFDPKHIFFRLHPDDTWSKLLRTEEPTNLGREMDQLALNLGYSRSWAGYAYGEDIEHAMALGEKIALKRLRSLIKSYAQKIKVNFHSLKGQELVITNIPVRSPRQREKEEKNSRIVMKETKEAKVRNSKIVIGIRSREGREGKEGRGLRGSVELRGLRGSVELRGLRGSKEARDSKDKDRVSKVIIEEAKEKGSKTSKGPKGKAGSPGSSASPRL